MRRTSGIVVRGGHDELIVRRHCDAHHSPISPHELRLESTLKTFINLEHLVGPARDKEGTIR